MGRETLLERAMEQACVPLSDLACDVTQTVYILHVELFLCPRLSSPSLHDPLVSHQQWLGTQTKQTHCVWPIDIEDI